MKTKIKNLIYNLPLIKNILFYRNFKVEIDLLKNKHKSQSNLTSIIHFSINKAATQYVKSVLRKVSNENGLISVSIHDYAGSTKMPFLDDLTFEQMKKYKHIFKPTGYLYSVFGGMIENIDNFEEYNVILSIRDPRDILVSNYYSTAFSHPLPPTTSNKRDDFLKKREWARNISVDEYVLSESNQVYYILDRYQRNLIDKYNNVGIVKYESMTSTYDSWLTDLVCKSGLEISKQLKDELLGDFERNKVKKENKYVHLRKGVSGDYKEKLKDNTIKKLNSQFDELLEFFGYQK